MICSPTIVQYRAAVIGLVTGRMLGCLLCCWSYHSPGVALSGLLLNFFFFQSEGWELWAVPFFFRCIDLSLKDTERQWKSRIFKTFWHLCGGYSCPVFEDLLELVGNLWQDSPEWLFAFLDNLCNLQKPCLLRLANASCDRWTFMSKFCTVILSTANVFYVIRACRNLLGSSLYTNLLITKHFWK